MRETDANMPGPEKRVEWKDARGLIVKIHRDINNRVVVTIQWDLVLPKARPIAGVSQCDEGAHPETEHYLDDFERYGGHIKVLEQTEQTMKQEPNTPLRQAIGRLSKGELRQSKPIPPMSDQAHEDVKPYLGDPPVPPAKQSQGQEALDNLQLSLTHLNTALRTLADKISPILGGPDDGEDVKGQPEPTSDAAYVNTVMQCTAALHSEINFVNGLADRVRL